MGSLTDHNQNNIGSEVATNKNITWQSIQEFYHEIVGEKENIKKRFTEPYQFEMNDIEHLHNTIEQVAKTYQLKTSNYKISHLSTDGNNLSLPSFDQFKLFSQSNTNATKAITLEYNFLIEHSETKKNHNYKIIINIISGIAIFSEVQEEVPKLFWSSILYDTGRVQIEFVDYAIAQNFMSTISSWFHSRKVARNSKIFLKLQANSHWAPHALKFIFLIISVCLLISARENTWLSLFGVNSSETFILVGLSTVFIMTEIGYKFGKTIEKAIDRIWRLACIKINSGDNTLYKKIEEENRSCWISILWKLAITCFVPFIFFLASLYVK